MVFVNWNLSHAVRTLNGIQAGLQIGQSALSQMASFGSHGRGAFMTAYISLDLDKYPSRVEGKGRPRKYYLNLQCSQASQQRYRA